MLARPSFPMSAPQAGETLMDRDSTIGFVVAVLGILALGIVSGCRPGDRGGGPPLTADARADPNLAAGQLDVWGWSIAAKSLRKLVPAFNRKFPNISVNVDMTGANMQTRFLLSLSAGVGAPDISQLQMVDAPKYIATRRMTDLTAVASKYEKMFPASLWKNCKFDGKIHAIPWDMGPCAVYYKRELFDRHGIDPNAIETWDDFIAAGKIMLDRSRGKTKMMPLSTGSMRDMYEILMQQNGGQLFDEQGRVAVNSQRSVRTLGVLERLLDSGICANIQMWGHEFMAGLKSDTIATYPMAVWFGGTIKDTVEEYAGQASDWGVFRLPALEKGGLRTSNLGGSVLVIPDQCKQKAAAWAFIEYALCTVEGQVAQYENFDLFPAFLPALEHPYFDKPDPFYGGQKAGRLFAVGITRIPPLNRTRDWVQAVRYLDQALSRWAIGRAPAREFLDTFERKLHGRIGREISPASLSMGGGS